MKKAYLKPKYKRWHDRRAQKIGGKSRVRKKYNPNKRLYAPINLNKNKNAEIIEAPSNLCLFLNTENCLNFFHKMRKRKFVWVKNRISFIELDLSSIIKFDYSSVCVLISLIRDLKSKGIYTRSNLPKNNGCRDLIIESGLLTFMFDENGNRFPKSEKSEMLFIEKGSKKLTRKDNILISTSVKKVVKHLTGVDHHYPKIRRILLEICGNTIEWSGTTKKQWLFATKYEEDRVIFTVTDVGDGILGTLNKKFSNVLKDVFLFKKPHEILEGAFLKKYGSKSKEPNRNKGLPCIKNSLDNGVISDLKVLTNKVLINYKEKGTKKSKTFDREQFNGTLYRWEVNKDNLI